MKTLYPEIEPFDSGMLKVSDIHDIYYERVGNPEGIPVVFLHGGPGGGLIPMYRSSTRGLVSSPRQFPSNTN